MRQSAEVVVIGAGMAGLRAAGALAEAGIDVVVLEARDRVGGRAWSMKDDEGHVIDRGGQWIGPGQDRLAAVADEAGVATFPTYTAGTNIELRDGERFEYTGLIPTSDADASAELVASLLDLDLMALEVPVEAPWTVDDAEALDRETFGSYLERTIESRVARAVVEVATQAIWGAHPDELSLLYVLAYLHGGGGFSNLSRTTAGAQERRFETGSGSLVEFLATTLRDRIELSAPVAKITWSDDGVSIDVEGAGHALVARRAILAMPPLLADEIIFDPPIPERRALAAGMPMGRVIKVHARYPSPFWREQGLSGQLLSTSGSISSTFDNSPADASCGALVGFIAGRDADRLRQLPDAERKELVVGELVAAFGPEAATPIEYHEIDWTAEPFTKGGPVALSTPGTLVEHGAALRAPHGPLHFAGTETALVWSGYLEGALESGERAAREVIASLATEGGAR